MSEIFERLKEERGRLGFKRQDALAEKLGVSTTSVSNYESGKRQPDVAYLAAFAALGADVLYVVTGRRAALTVSDEQAKLLAAYDAAPGAIKAAALAVLSTTTTSGSGRPQLRAVPDPELEPLPEETEEDRKRHEDFMRATDPVVGGSKAKTSTASVSKPGAKARSFVPAAHRKGGKQD